MAPKLPAAKVSAIKHRGASRATIPTEELRDFVAKDEDAPTTLLYPRDPSLDPQLVWKGKDELDREDLAVPAVPIYIQEKIHPEALVNDLAARTRMVAAGGVAEEEAAYQVSLFADFDDPADFERKIAFYEHAQQWTNRMILGDSLLVMASLAEKEGLKGKVQCIYIDPPYGINFSSNWQVSTRSKDVKDGKSDSVTRQPEQIRAFRDTWVDGTNSYLTYLRDRLRLAVELLADTGSIFMQIGDENVHRVRSVLDEVFGPKNFIGLITFRKKNMPFGARYIEGMVDYIIWYGKDADVTKYHPLFLEKDVQGASRWTMVELPDGTSRRMTGDEFRNHRLLPKGSRVYTHASLKPSGTFDGGFFDVVFEGKVYPPPTGGCWATTQEGMARLIAAERIGVENNNLRYKLFLDDYPVSRINNFWTDTSGESDKTYVVQTMSKVVQRCILMTTDPGDLVLDPTCGSGTTAFVAEQWGRRWITVDTSRVALALARTRLMAAKYPWYLLADSEEGQRKDAEMTGVVAPPHTAMHDVRKGFVYKRANHITLQSIANNPDIRDGMMRQEIDAAIAGHVDSETLYDQPYEDTRRVRVSGPFTMESLSPHRVLATADEDLDGIVSPDETLERRDFTTMILDNMAKAGVQNTYKAQRIRFDRLEPYAGRWIQGEGEFTDADGQPVRVAVSIGPEHGTVGPEQVKEAAKEAVQGIGFDLLLVCGFALDPHVNEEAKRFGNLTVLPTRMNPDLSMGDDLLKKTGAGNLFMVFGEPDIAVTDDGGQIAVELRGVDVYDPTTGDVRSNSTDDVACWFIDTDYNEEAFFVRHAYFTGDKEPYKQLKNALKAEIDEDAWASLYSTTSRPFPRPKGGRIAVKAINHYGDEVLKVFQV